ncbi:MAG: hypothetical protein CBC38_02580 [Gammaproteobacteria bacterium TMED78]|nr:MAG: hypothetical protein CBC38_02580 [Gammaproteobacteria bacterium TMED78]|tara:strand:+ start:115293 stop:116006 length:714 start_codon:yes stop_codon:yes gene_type:complete
MKGEESNKKEKALNDIDAFLDQNPDIFNDHPRLLEKINLSYDSQQGSVSLVERQVAILKAQNLKYKKELENIIIAGEKNEFFLKKIHKLYLKQIIENNLVKRMDLIDRFLHQGFSIASAVIIIFSSINNKVLSYEKKGFIKLVSRDHKKLDSFASFFESGQPRCGAIKDDQRDFLFGNEKEINSAALIPIGSKLKLGFLAIGSEDKDYFNPSLSTDILSSLGELIYAILSNSEYNNE